MNKFFQAKKYLTYLLKAKTKYYLHSPFVYQFYLNVLEGENDNKLQKILLLREKLRNNNTALKAEDFGTGNSFLKKVSDIERGVSVRHKYGMLLYRLVKCFQPKNILEIGTSIGLSSSYLALANADAKIVSLEGSKGIAAVAKQNHISLEVKNVEVVSGNFNQILSSSLQQLPSADLVFFDGNHTKEATLKYFFQCLEKSNENSVFVFDDIYWSEEMSEVWEEIKLHHQVTLTIDVYQFGICFFRKKKLAKEDFVLWY